MLLMFWVSRPVAWNAAFSTFIFPCLGFLVLPITTMVYVWLLQGVGNSIQGLDWLWLFLAFLMDVASIGAAGAANRDRFPAGVPGSTAGTGASRY
jgi:hypothetical protein